MEFKADEVDILIVRNRVGKDWIRKSMGRLKARGSGLRVLRIVRGIRNGVISLLRAEFCRRGGAFFIGKSNDIGS